MQSNRFSREWCLDNPQIAADKIERLQAALKPFAFLGSILTGKEKDSSIFMGQVTYDEQKNPTYHPVTFGDLRHAHAILTK